MNECSLDESMCTAHTSDVLVAVYLGGHGVAGLQSGEKRALGVSVRAGDPPEGIWTIIDHAGGWSWGSEPCTLVHTPELCRLGRDRGLS